MNNAIESLKKGTEKVMVALTPEERARYAFNEFRGITQDEAEGKDTRTRVKDLETFVKNFASSRGAVEYSQYLRELFDLNTRAMAAEFQDLALRAVIAERGLLKRETTYLKLIFQLCTYIHERTVNDSDEEFLSEIEQRVLPRLQQRLIEIQCEINSINESSLIVNKKMPAEGEAQ